jgi:hypothetical protein
MGDAAWQLDLFEQPGRKRFCQRPVRGNGRGEAMVGVSPGFVFSLYGTRFSVAAFCDALPRIKRLGFFAYQPEIYVTEAIPEWCGRQVTSSGPPPTSA